MVQVTNKAAVLLSCNIAAFKEGKVHGACLVYQQQKHSTTATTKQAIRIWSKH